MGHEAGEQGCGETGEGEHPGTPRGTVGGGNHE